MKSHIRRITKQPLKLIAGCFLLFFFVGITLQSCIKKEDFDFNNITLSNWSPNGAAPLIHSRLTLKDILKSNQMFQEDANHFLTLVYRSTVFSKRADELISVPDQNFNIDTSFITGSIVIGDSVLIPKVINVAFTTTNGERFDSVLIKTGTLNFNINSDINHTGRIYLFIPNLKKNGVQFSGIIDYIYPGITPPQSFNIDGYTLSFNPGNQITLNCIIKVYGDLNSDNSPYHFHLDNSISGITFYKIFGYLGQINLPFRRDSVMVDIFKNNISGSIMFADPKLNIYVDNAFGMPLAFTIDTLNAYSTVNPPYMVAINPAGLPYPWTIVAPTFAQMGQSIETAFYLNNTNSNIGTALNMSPQYFYCSAKAQTNPLGNPLAQNFVIDTSRISLDVEAELPLYGSAWDFVLQDTIDFDMGGNVNNLEWVKFKTNTLNGFPIDVIMQVYFADSANIKLDSMFVPAEQVINSGIIGPAPDYKVITPTHKASTVQINQDKLSHLGNTKKLIIHAHLSTANNGATVIKFYSDYDIDVKIGVQAQLKNIH